MNEEPVDQTPPEPEPEQSLAEHEAEFGSAAQRPAADPEPEPDEDPRRPPRERDDQGKFTKPPKHRAAKQEATAADVPRIAELTRRLRETEAERDALRSRPRTAPIEAPGVPDAILHPPVPRGNTATTATKPKIDDFQEYGDYVEALADWKIAEARRQDREVAQKDAETARISASWRERTEAAKAKYADFEQVALLAPTTIPQGSLIDAWILEDTSGADVLYTLQKDPGELSRILALPIFEQVKALSLLAQRLSPTREPAVRTGAAATPPVKVAPRPPTPVRTSAVPAPDEPPDPEHASLAEFERYYHRDR